MRRLRIRFLNASEVRMGSPYNTCRVSLSGEWVPRLPNDGDDYQDLKAWSEDQRHLALVRWAVRANQPGFKVVVISLAGRRVTQYRRRKGCCEAIWWKDGAFRFRASTIVQGSVRLEE